MKEWERNLPNVRKRQRVCYEEFEHIYYIKRAFLNFTYDFGYEIDFSILSKLQVLC